MRVAQAPVEPDAAANDRWPIPLGRVLPSLHRPRPRVVSDAATVPQRRGSSHRTIHRNIQGPRP